MAEEIVIAGVGTTDFSRQSGRTELQLAAEAVVACLDDAGVPAEDIDGMVTFTIDKTSEIDLQRELGCQGLNHFSRIPQAGGGGCATVGQAAMAIRAGIVRYAIAYRSLNAASGVRFGSGKLVLPPGTGDHRPVTEFGLFTAASMVGITARYYLQKYGLGDDSYAHFALTAREYAATNPAAHFFGRPLTLSEYLDAPWISKPLRRYDCCQESDGAVALLITTAERARDLRTTPVRVLAAAQSAGFDQGAMAQYWSEDLLKLPEVEGLGKQLHDQSGMAPTEVDAVMLYDHFTPLVALQLEQFGFCGEGEATRFAEDGHLRLNGSMPMNTHGGHLGEAYLHGMNHIGEAVRQLRGDAANQLQDVASIMVASGAAIPSSALILGRV